MSPSTATVTLTAEETEQVKILLKQQTKTANGVNEMNGNVSNIIDPEKGEGDLHVRVQVVAKEEDVNVPGGHEVIGISSGSNYDNLCHTIAKTFRSIQALNSKGRSNMNSIWTPQTKVEKVKAIWSSGSGWSDNGPGISETVLTTANCISTLKAMKERGNIDALSVVVSADV